MTTSDWLRVAKTEPARCQGCGGYAEAASFDVLRGEVVLRCAAYHRCSWTSAEGDVEPEAARQAALWGEGEAA